MKKTEIIAAIEAAILAKEVNYDDLNEIYKAVGSIKKAAKAEADEIKKAAKAEENAESAKLGKAYFDSLPAGAHFHYRNASGDVIEAIKSEKQTGTTAGCELVNPPENAKSTKRYPKFHQIVIPATMEEVA